MRIFFILLFCLFVFSNIKSQIGWVGNMWPASGNINQGSGFTIYIQVWKDGVTNPPGQGAGILCQIYYGSVPSFGGSWSNISTQAMTYNTDIGNNDEYLGVLNLASGLYEYTCRCSDNGGSTWKWRDGSNGQLTVNAPLGVDWKSFSVEGFNKIVKLTWTTASETNNEGFEIERSTDGISWEVIGFEKGHGNSSKAVSYTWTDAHPKPGINYYRLRQLDFDGRQQYSEVKQVFFGSQTILNVSPNPFESDLLLQLAETATVEVLNTSGKMFYSADMGPGQHTVDLGSLYNGMYFIRVITPGKTEVKTIFRK